MIVRFKAIKLRVDLRTAIDKTDNPSNQKSRSSLKCRNNPQIFKLVKTTSKNVQTYKGARVLTAVTLE